MWTLRYILSIDIFKSYLYNKYHHVLNKTEDPFFTLLDIFLGITDKFEESFIYITKKNSFLSGNLEKFQQYLLGDCNELLTFFKISYQIFYNNNYFLNLK